MALAFDEVFRDTGLFSTKAFQQRLAVWEGNHSVFGAMNHHDAVSSHAFGDADELLGRFEVPSGSDCL
jgi:hypothetical protein